VWLSGISTKLQVPGQPQVQWVFGQHQHWTQPCTHSQLGAPEPQQRVNPILSAWLCCVDREPDGNPASPIHETIHNSMRTGKSCHHLWIVVHTRVKSSWSWKDPWFFGFFPFSLPYPLNSSQSLHHNHFVLSVNPFIQDHAIPPQLPEQSCISLNSTPMLLLIWISAFFSMAWVVRVFVRLFYLNCLVKKWPKQHAQHFGCSHLQREMWWSFKEIQITHIR